MGFSKSFRGGVVPSVETVVQVILPTSCLCLIKHKEQTQPLDTNTHPQRSMWMEFILSSFLIH